MHSQLSRALDIAKRNKEKVIILDGSDHDSAYVIMPLDDYESISCGGNIKKLTEQELLDKINRDIAEWKSVRFKDEKKEDADSIHEFFDDFDLEDDYYEDADDYMDEPFIGPAEPVERAESKRKWKIPEDRKLGAEEIIEEDRQYLEEITF